MGNMDASQFTATKGSFGSWLIRQTQREDAIGDLAKSAAQDRGFPRSGDFQAVSKYLNHVQAPGDMHMALEDAELDWAAI